MSAGGPRPLRVLHVLTFYLPHRTGLTLHVQRLAEALVRRGHAVSVLSARFRPDLPLEDDVNGVRVVRLRAPVRISRGVVMPSYPLAAWRLLGGHDVVHVHSPMLELPLVAALARLRRRPLVVTHHGDLVLPGGPADRVVQAAMTACYRLGVAGARRVVAYSDDYAGHSSWLRPVRDRVVTIPPPVVLPEPAPDAVAALRDRFGLSGRPVVGYAGRFVAEKRPDLLLAALPAIRARFPGAVAVFAGPERMPYEDYRSRCAALLEREREHVRFTGLIDDAGTLAAFYRLCDVLVLPSATECFGLVQVEAMLAGTPVVATDIPGARVPVRATGMGRIVPPGDAAALADGVVEVLAEPRRFVRPRPEIEAVFSLDATVDAHERLYREILR